MSLKASQILPEDIEVNSTPRDLDSERGFLASIFQDDNLITELQGLPEDFFYCRENQAIANLVLELQSTDLNTLRSEIFDRGLIVSPTLIYEIATDGAIPQLCRGYKERIREAHSARHRMKFMEQIEEMQQEGKSHSEICDAMVAFGAKETSRVQSQKRGMVSINDAASLALSELEERMERGGRLPGISWGPNFPYLDQFTNGLRPGHLVVLSAESGMGKTSLAYQVANHCALTAGERTIYFTKEMTAEEIIMRSIASRAKIDGMRLDRGELNSQEFHRVLAEIKKFKEASEGILMIDDTARGLRDIEAGCARLANEDAGLRVAVVDYAQLFQCDTAKADNREGEIREISRTCKEIAMSYGITLILLSQLNDDGKLRESRALEHDANIWINISRAEDVEEDDEDEDDDEEEMIVNRDVFIDIKKCRGGQVARIPSTFHGPTTTFKETGQNPMRLKKKKRRYVKSRGGRKW